MNLDDDFRTRRIRSIVGHEPPRPHEYPFMYTGSAIATGCRRRRRTTDPPPAVTDSPRKSTSTRRPPKSKWTSAKHPLPKRSACQSPA